MVNKSVSHYRFSNYFKTKRLQKIARVVQCMLEGISETLVYRWKRTWPDSNKKNATLNSPSLIKLSASRYLRDARQKLHGKPSLKKEGADSSQLSIIESRPLEFPSRLFLCFPRKEIFQQTTRTANIYLTYWQLSGGILLSGGSVIKCVNILKLPIVYRLSWTDGSSRASEAWKRK